MQQSGEKEIKGIQIGKKKILLEDDLIHHTVNNKDVSRELLELINE